MDFLLNKLEYLKDSDQTAAEKAVSIGQYTSFALNSIYRSAGVDVPEGDSMLAKLNGAPVKAFFLEREELCRAVNFIRILMSNAKHGLKIRPKDVELARQHAIELVETIHGAEVRPRSISEAETRKLYIDVYLEEAGWKVREDKGAIHAGEASIEVEVEGMPGGKKGYCDYVLFGRDGLPLAVVEAKKTSENVEKGRQQVKLYGKCLEARYHVKPVLYYTNGYEIWIDDRIYPERRVHAFHSMADLERLVQRQNRGKITDTKVNENIAGRAYQIAAVKAVCERFNKKDRNALLVMATGTGKTRTVVSIVDVLTRHDWVKNVLFLADRKELVKQAFKEGFNPNLPNMTYHVLSDISLTPGSDAETARVVLSTYQTLIRKIDTDEKLFKSGRFDLIVVDEAHRSIFKKYAIIFDYFDALKIGLTATPRDQVDKSTYERFHCDQGTPDFEYTIKQGIDQGFLTKWQLINRTTKILRKGVKYDDLSEAEKEAYEEAFEETGVAAPESVEAERIFRSVYNKDTCAKVLEELMKLGHKVDNGELLGKSLIFAANHEHAEMVREVFSELYPELAAMGYLELIDNRVKMAESLIDDFKSKTYPRIVVSVDMMDTGIDVPEILNLVYFREVHSKIKFFQMLGRGTRVCKNLFGPGKDKKDFKVFDYCGNFDYFIGEGGEGEDLESSPSITQRVFVQRLKLMLALQSVDQQSIETRKKYWKELHHIVHEQIKAAKKADKRVSVRAVLPILDKFVDGEKLKKLDDKTIDKLEVKISPIIDSNLAEHPLVKAFDLKMLKIETAAVTLGSAESVKKDVVKIRDVATKLLKLGTLADVVAKKTQLEKMASSEFWKRANLEDVEALRKDVRGLVVHLKNDDKVENVYLNIEDEIEPKSNPENEVDYRTYRERVIDYLLKHSDTPAVRKLANLEPLKKKDVDELERVLYKELGTIEDFREAKKADNYEGSLAGFLRTLIGLKVETIQEKFAAFLNENTFNAKQHEFLDSVVNYIQQNGEITCEDLANKSPFDAMTYQDDFDDRMPELMSIFKFIRETFEPIAA